MKGDSLKRLQKRAIKAVGHCEQDDVIHARRTWCDLMNGEWRLITVFSRSGRQFMIAKRVTGTKEPLLTDRERRVLGLRARAQGIKSIAVRLTMSQATVRRALVEGMRKLGLSSAADLARFETF